jgi:hypothetical protein
VVPAAHSASASLGVPGSLTARVYFGQLGSVVSGLSNRVTFNTPTSYRSAHPHQCVLTVVFSGVSGSQAAVYAQGLGSGWTGAESAPDQNVSTDSGVVHQQLVVPPGAASKGQAWNGSAFVRVDQDPNQDHHSSEYSLKLSSRSGSNATWKFAGTTVVCSLS